MVIHAPSHPGGGNDQIGAWLAARRILQVSTPTNRRPKRVRGRVEVCRVSADIAILLQSPRFFLAGYRVACTDVEEGQILPLCAFFGPGRSLLCPYVTGRFVLRVFPRRVFRFR